MGELDAALEELAADAASFVGEGRLPSLQLALARDGRILLACAFGRARFGDAERAVDERTLYSIFSSTKAIVSSAIWLLWQDGKLDPSERVVDAIPEFATNGKESVRIEHLLTHTCGFPNAPFAPLDWNDPARRMARFGQWRLDFEPGSRFAYHRTTSMWVLAEVIERRAGMDFRRFLRERIAEPLGLDDLHVGLAEELNARAADVVHFGDPAAADALEGMGLSVAASLVDDEKYFSAYNRAEVRAVGAPGSGGLSTASALALYYQGLLHDAAAPAGRERVWRAETLAKALAVRTGELIDPMTRKRANRALGMVIAGSEDSVYRSFGSGCSPAAFGHAGAGGQVAWADPATGISFVCLTNGFDRDVLRLGMRGVVLSSLAAACGAAAVGDL